MSDIVKLTGNIFETHHVFVNGALGRRISLPGSTAVFNFTARRQRDARGVPSILLTVTADAPGMKFEAKIATRFLEMKSEDVVSHVKNSSTAPFLNYNLEHPMYIKIEFLDPNLLTIEGNRSIPDFGDLESYIERGTQVILEGSDGSVTAPKRLLEMRSSVLEMIFSHDSREKQTGTIELNDYDSNTLDAFAHFLMTGEIKNGKNTALGLLLLGDKYDIQFMKKEAERFVKSHFRELDQDEAVDIMCQVSKEIVKEGLLRAWWPE